VKSGALSKRQLFTAEDEAQFKERDREHYQRLMSTMLVDQDHLLWPFVVDFWDHCFFWTLIEQAEFLVIIFSSTFVSNILSQLTVALMGICLFMGLVLYFRPYREDQFNTIEVCNDSIQITVLLIGISFAFEENRPLSETTSGAFILLLVITSCCLVTYAIVHDIQLKFMEWRKRSFEDSTLEGKMHAPPELEDASAIDAGNAASVHTTESMEHMEGGLAPSENSPK